MAITKERLLWLLAFVVAIAFWPTVPGAALVLRWCGAALGGTVLLLHLRATNRQKIDIPSPAHLVGAGLLVWGCLSLLWGEGTLDGALEILQWELVALPAFLVGASGLSLAPAYQGFAVGLGVSLLFCIGQLLGYHPVPQLVGPAGLFVNRNPLGELAALVAIGCVASRLWGYAPLPLLAVGLSGSRLAICAVVVSVVAGAFGVRWRWAILGLVLCLTPIVAYTVGGRSAPALGDRLAIWQDTIEGLTPLGRGIGSYFVAYPLHSDHMMETNSFRPDHAHNDFLEMAFELGPIGLVLLLAMFAISLGRLEEPEHYVILTLGVLCLGAFPLHYPATLFLGALAAGRASRTSDRLLSLLRYVRMACGAWLGPEDDESASGGVRGGGPMVSAGSRDQMAGVAVRDSVTRSG